MRQARLARHKIPAQSAMARVVQGWASAPRRTPIARFSGASPLPRELREDYRAVVAETQVGEILDDLGRQWDVLHDLPLREGSLDHLVIGPGGVFAVQTVDCRGLEVSVDTAGALRIGMKRRDELSRARSVAEEVSALLTEASGGPVDVRALLVMVEARRLSSRDPAPERRIALMKELERTLLRAPRVLAGDEVAAISDVAEQSRIWPRLDPSELDTVALNREFAEIRTAVRRAIERRALWIAVGFGLLCGLVWGLVASLVAGLL